MKNRVWDEEFYNGDREFFDLLVKSDECKEKYGVSVSDLDDDGIMENVGCYGLDNGMDLDEKLKFIDGIIVMMGIKREMVLLEEKQRIEDEE